MENDVATPDLAPNMRSSSVQEPPMKTLIYFSFLVPEDLSTSDAVSILQQFVSNLPESTSIRRFEIEKNRYV